MADSTAPTTKGSVNSPTSSATTMGGIKGFGLHPEGQGGTAGVNKAYSPTKPNANKPYEKPTGKNVFVPVDHVETGVIRDWKKDSIPPVANSNWGSQWKEGNAWDTKAAANAKSMHSSSQAPPPSSGGMGWPADMIPQVCTVSGQIALFGTSQ